MSSEHSTSALTPSELETQTAGPLPSRELMSLVGGSSGSLFGTDMVSMPANPPSDMGADYANPYQYGLFKPYG